MLISSLSGGRTSAYMTYLLKDKIDLCIFCNTGKEAEGTLLFVKRCGEYFDIPIVWLEYDASQKKPNGSLSLFKIVTYETAARKGEPYKSLIEHRKMIPNTQFRTCTVELKIETIKRYLRSINVKQADCEMMLGIRADEPKRYHNSLTGTRNKWEASMPLFKMGVTKPMVLDWWSQQPFDLEIHEEGGNCNLCFLKGFQKKVKYLKDNPDEAQWWIEQETAKGHTFNKDYSVQEILDYANAQLNPESGVKIREQLNRLYAGSYDIDCHCNID